MFTIKTIVTIDGFEWGSCWSIVCFLCTVLSSIVCRLLLLFLLSIVLSVLWFTDSDTPLVSFVYCIVCHLIYGFWYSFGIFFPLCCRYFDLRILIPFWYLQILFLNTTWRNIFLLYSLNIHCTSIILFHIIKVIHLALFQKGMIFLYFVKLIMGFMDYIIPLKIYLFNHTTLLYLTHIKTWNSNIIFRCPPFCVQNAHVANDCSFCWCW